MGNTEGTVCRYCATCEVFTATSAAASTTGMRPCRAAASGAASSAGDWGEANSMSMPSAERPPQTRPAPVVRAGGAARSGRGRFSAARLGSSSPTTSIAYVRRWRSGPAGQQVMLQPLQQRGVHTGKAGSSASKPSASSIRNAQASQASCVTGARVIAIPPLHRCMQPCMQRPL